MPAGNDSQAAASELADQFGEGAGNADNLIAARRDLYEGDLAKANLAERDEEATAKLDFNEVARKAKTDIKDAAVRGDFVTYVYTDEDGRDQKGVLSRDKIDSAEATERVGRKNSKKSDTATAADTGDSSGGDNEELLKRLEAAEKAAKDAEKAAADAEKRADKAEKDAAKAAEGDSKS